MSRDSTSKTAPLEPNPCTRGPGYGCHIHVVIVLCTNYYYIYVLAMTVSSPSNSPFPPMAGTKTTTRRCTGEDAPKSKLPLYLAAWGKSWPDCRLAIIYIAVMNLKFHCEVVEVLFRPDCWIGNIVTRDDCHTQAIIALGTLPALLSLPPSPGTDIQAETAVSLTQIQALLLTSCRSLKLLSPIRWPSMP